LQREQICHNAVEPLRPEMRVALGINQLGVDADFVARPPDASLQHIAHAKLAADLLGINPLALISERGIARDHQHACEPRQIGCQILGDAVGEILLLRVVA